MKDDRSSLVNVVKQKHPFAETGDTLVHRFPIEALLSRIDALQSIQNFLFVALRLETPDEPGARVGESFVIEVDRILGRYHQTHSKGPGLFQKGQQRSLRGRLGNRWHIPEDLVHVEEGPKARRTRTRPHPAQGLVQEQGHEEHPFRVREMSNREDRDSRFALWGVEDLAHI
jgi:hypothetical protein